jgi:hypothetical protein
MKGRAAERASLFNSAQQFPRSASSRWLNMENDGMLRRDHHSLAFALHPLQSHCICAFPFTSF